MVLEKPKLTRKEANREIVMTSDILYDAEKAYSDLSVNY